jgi:hypothetical protein
MLKRPRFINKFHPIHELSTYSTVYSIQCNKVTQANNTAQPRVPLNIPKKEEPEILCPV